jgi:hypothetical protein
VSQQYGYQSPKNGKKIKCNTLRAHKKNAILCESHPVGPPGLEVLNENTPQGFDLKEVTEYTSNPPTPPRVHDWVHLSRFSPELQEIIETWPHIKTAVLALVEAHIDS